MTTTPVLSVDTILAYLLAYLPKGRFNDINFLILGMRRTKQLFEFHFDPNSWCHVFSIQKVGLVAFRFDGVD